MGVIEIADCIDQSHDVVWPEVRVPQIGAGQDLQQGFARVCAPSQLQQAEQRLDEGNVEEWDAPAEPYRDAIPPEGLLQKVAVYIHIAHHNGNLLGGHTLPE